MSALLDIRDLSAGYGSLRVLHEINMTVARGERLAIVGLNGHGKTTLFRAITHLVGWQRGSIRLDGAEIGGARSLGEGRRTPGIVRLGVAMTPQGDAIFPGLTVRQHLDCGAWSRRAWRERARRREIIFELFSPLRKLEHTTVGTLSGGERRMVSVGRALMTEARLYLVDEPSLGVTCLDCHVNGHTNAAFHLNPDTRPQAARFRLDTVSLRGLFNQQIHGSKRSLRSVEDFTEFEQRTAYFDGDHVTAAKKGVNLPDRTSQVAMMAQMQNIFDFPPAPKLDEFGRLRPEKATELELMGEAVFFGKGRCAECHTPPFYLDNKMHDLRLERFYEPAMHNGQYDIADGPIKTFTLRGIKDSPPYHHDGRLLTLEDTVEFFNLVLGLELTSEEREALVAFMRCL